MQQSCIRSPYLQTNIYQIEMMQRKAARFVFNYSRHLSVTVMLNELNWQYLEKRRNDLTLLMLSKIINQHIDVPCNHILQKAFNFTHSSNRKFLHLSSRIDSFKYPFFPREIRLFNHLPDHIVLIKHLLTSYTI